MAIKQYHYGCPQGRRGRGCHLKKQPHTKFYIYACNPDRLSQLSHFITIFTIFRHFNKKWDFWQFCCCSCKYAAICGNTAFKQLAFPRIVIITSTSISQILCYLMHAVQIYSVCCKMPTMLHICCSMQLHPDFCIHELSKSVLKHNWVILKIYLPFLGIVTKTEIFNNFWCCSCKYAAICCNTAFEQWAFPRIFYY